MGVKRQSRVAVVVYRVFSTSVHAFVNKATHSQSVAAGLSLGEGESRCQK